jgi:hypothetical protein
MSALSLKKLTNKGQLRGKYQQFYLIPSIYSVFIPWARFHIAIERDFAPNNITGGDLCWIKQKIGRRSLQSVGLLECNLLLYLV